MVSVNIYESSSLEIFKEGTCLSLDFIEQMECSALSPYLRGLV